MSRDPLTFLSGLARQHGDVVRFPIGRETLHLLNHPDLIRDVLVTNQRNFKKGRGLERAKLLLGEGLLTSEGEAHLRQRRMMQPAFHRQRIAAYGDIMRDYSVRRASRWRHGSRFNLHAEMMALTMAIVGRTLFGADVEEEAPEVGEALAAAFEAFNFSFFLPFGELLERLPLPSSRRFKRGRARLDATIYRIIADRRRSGTDTGDLLSMLLLARDDEGDGAAMSDLQLRDEVMTLFLAGHETTANALTWTWYLLAKHPEVERRLQAEVDALPGDPSAADLPQLPYTRMVLSESMRLYPPAWIVGRRALGAFDAGGHAIPARSIVIVSPWVTQRDGRWFPDPERFDPQRWRPEVAADRPKFSYFPFGGGTRICIGEQFAWMEGILALAAIARRWSLRLVPGHQVTLQPIITLRPKSGVMVEAESRQPG
jgi:cytochrome P450